MALLEINWNASNSLVKMTSFTAIVPDNCPKRCPTLYLLHGMSDDHTGWARRTLIERYVSNLPLIIIFPDGARSFYSDSRTNPYEVYETFLVQSLIPYVDQILPTIKNGKKRAIAGLSMGGYGALKLAMKYPDRFTAGFGFSGAYNFGHTHAHSDPRRAKEHMSIFGKKLMPENDVFALAKKLNPKRMPTIHFDCGLDDFCLSWNRKLHDHLDKFKISHTYEEHPGNHNWNYWNKGILRILPKILKCLQIKATFDPKSFEQ